MARRGAHLGQHFLNNPHYAQVLAQAAGVATGSAVLEIGSGTGALTRELLKTGARVVAIEKDASLVEVLKTTFADAMSRSDLDIVNEDVRNFDPAKHTTLANKPYVLAANIPYYITGEIIRQFLETPVQPKTIALLIQREVAQRIVSETESILSISVKAYGTPKIIAKVTKGNFTPPPSVDSAILAITDISKKNFEHVDEKKFFAVVRAGFAAKRKLLANNLGVVFGKEAALQALVAAQVPPHERAENVHVPQWLSLAASLQK